MLTRVGGHCLNSFQNIPEELTSVATERYLGGTDDPVKKRELFLDLMADLMFGVPSVAVARGHRGESWKTDSCTPSLVSDLLTFHLDRYRKF